MKGLRTITITLLKISLFLAFYSTMLFVSPTFAYSPRVFLWALGGSDALGRLDVMLPIYHNYSDFFYADIQGEADTKTNWFTGIGAGFRFQRDHRIWGSYVFIDGNVSKAHNKYGILNPGFETIGFNWDGRINGYLPVTKKVFRQQITPPFRDTCGLNFGCDDSVFTGHQQFLKIFKRYEEVGPGLDAELGWHFGHNKNFSIYGGGYYFHFSHEESLKGVEARAVIPFKPAVAFTVETSYDNLQHGAIMAGIRLQGGHLPHTPLLLSDPMYEPVVRNLATIKSGLSAPVARTEKLDRLQLVRDNIYFFSSSGGTDFAGFGTGTFENPLAADQFTQTVVDGIAAITPNANLFFNTGTYIINPGSPDVPNASIVLPVGQSLFGRTLDYRCSAVAGERPILLGEIELLSPNHSIDSIILANNFAPTELASPALVNVVALTLEDATNVTICNSDITAAFNFSGTTVELDAFVTAIAANDSSVTINNSTINAILNTPGLPDNSLNVIGIGGNNSPAANNTFAITDSSIFASGHTILGSIGAVGIGNVGTVDDANFQNNIVTLVDSSITTEAVSTGPSVATFMSMSVGIGTISTDTTSQFIDNTFTIINSDINSSAFINNFIAASSAIGSVAISNFGPSDAQFIGNTFTISDSQLNSNASSNNTEDVFVMAAGIGGNAVLEANASFLNNAFSITNTSINSSAISTSSPLVESFATAIGGNAAGVNTFANFDGNSFTIQSSQLSSLSQVATLDADFDNMATVIGGNAESLGEAGFGVTAMNNFMISNSSLSSAGIVLGDNAGNNLVSGVGGNNPNPLLLEFSNTRMQIDSSTLNVLANVKGANSIAASQNIARGLIATTGSLITFDASQGVVAAVVEGGVAVGSTNTAVATLEQGGTIVLSNGSTIQTIIIP